MIREGSKLNQAIWRKMAAKRRALGISAAYAIRQLGVSSTTFWRLETKGHGQIERIGEYAEKVLHMRAVILPNDGEDGQFLLIPMTVTTERLKELLLGETL